MRSTLAAMAFLIVGLSPAWAIVGLGTSNQIFTLTGVGPDSSGNGQSHIGWGTCSFDGTNTNCTLSGAYTGLGDGGNYSFVLSYPGKGPFPLDAITQPGSNFFSARATGPYSLVITLSPVSGQPIHFYDFANFSFVYATGATCTGVSAANCGVGQVGITPGATITGPVIGNFDPTPVIRTAAGVITAGGYGGFSSIAPGTWIEIYGINLANTLQYLWQGSDFTGTQAPASLQGTRVTIAGIPAYIDYVSPDQVNAQVPSGVPNGTQPVVVATAGGTSTAFNINVNTTEPGMLAPSAFVINGSQYIVALFSNTLTFALPGSVPGIATSVPRAGDKLTLYGIGFGLVAPSQQAGQIVQQTNQLQNDFQITIGGAPAQVTYAGLAPGYVGLYQFNVVVPTVTAGQAVPVAVSLGGTPVPQHLVIPIQ